MKRHPTAILTSFCLLSASLAAAGDEIEILSPGFSPTTIRETGAIAEPWGEVQLRLLAPEGASVEAPKAEQIPMPAAVTRASAGAVVVTQTAYRAPIWPGGVDVLEACIQNTGQEPVQAILELALPETVQIGERIGMAGRSAALLLPANPAPTRDELDWGCTGGVSRLKGWAKPDVECDPAFRNIAAGMGGIPIGYRFAVIPGETRGIALGFCESHHPGPGFRAMDVTVEGAPPQTVDPNEKWGRHKPGVLQFAAADANRDGRIDVRVSPHPGTSDRNPILNAIWVFKDSAPVDESALVRGGLSSGAERFVDVGGEADQMLYQSANLRYVLDLAPGGQSELCFLLRNPDGGPVPDPATTTWTPERLRKAAAEVWVANAGR